MESPSLEDKTDRQEAYYTYSTQKKIHHMTKYTSIAVPFRYFGTSLASSSFSSSSVAVIGRLFCCLSGLVRCKSSSTTLWRSQGREDEENGAVKRIASQDDGEEDDES